MTIHIINGPNLNLLGTREPGIYGSSTFEDYLEKLRQRYPSINIQYYQSNVEGLLIDRLQGRDMRFRTRLVPPRHRGSYLKHTS